MITWHFNIFLTVSAASSNEGIPRNIDPKAVRDQSLAVLTSRARALAAELSRNSEYSLDLNSVAEANNRTGGENNINNNMRDNFYSYLSTYAPQDLVDLQVWMVITTNDHFDYDNNTNIIISGSGVYVCVR